VLALLLSLGQTMLAQEWRIRRLSFAIAEVTQPHFHVASAVETATLFSRATTARSRSLYLIKTSIQLSSLNNFKFLCLSHYGDGVEGARTGIILM
jgi:hypothetical protein